MLGTCITAGVVAIEVGLVAYNLHKQGVFTEMKHKFDVKFKRVADRITQPKLKELSWKIESV